MKRTVKGVYRPKSKEVKEGLYRGHERNNELKFQTIIDRLIIHIVGENIRRFSKNREKQF